eukprot:5821029-Prymnesium_polylepis.3
MISPGKGFSSVTPRRSGSEPSPYGEPIAEYGSNGAVAEHRPPPPPWPAPVHLFPEVVSWLKPPEPSRTTIVV